ncbi:hypothetical protein LCGC14_0751150 [marine sediment metagenome]|uniref:Uncharacterized protein n=1 Tax=marine sediment metagenome TaxID=412755 RepID=A0A0F9Q3V1_9ZZZZ|nr:MAG: hypothetical protein Lokiarch_29530 [Candidatus Lokiarchaeum sp. GC14_75]HEC39231.1 hypothetical protein [bacterium]
MALTNDKLKTFVDLLVERGLGLYGSAKMGEICYDSGIGLTDQLEIDWIEDDHFTCVQRLLVNYSSVNLVSKMTAIVLARRNNIPVPDKLLEKKKKKSRWKKRRN